jgi:hypothetical protein
MNETGGSAFFSIKIYPEKRRLAPFFTRFRETAPDAPAFKFFVLLCVLYKPQKAPAKKEEQLQYQKR